MRSPLRARLRLGLRNLHRDLRAGELTLVLVAVVIAVAAMSAVSLFIDRAERALARQGNALLAADLVVESSRPIGDDLVSMAKQYGLAVTQTLAMRSMIQQGDRLQLVELKAVQQGYPLRGQVYIADSAYGEARLTDAIPAPGTLWADARLLQELGVQVGDAVTVGASTLRIAQVLALEPDRAGGFFSISPRAVMNLGDVAATDLVMPGSRVTYRLLLAGTEQQTAAFRTQVQALDDRALRIVDIREARPELRTALERADLFLGMAALVAVIVAGIAIALAARRYAERHLDTAAIMRCLGASQRDITGILIIELLVLAVAASTIGVIVGFLAQQVLAAALSDVVGGELPPPSLRALTAALLVGIVVLIGFALTPVLSLKDVPSLRVLRRDLAPIPRRSAMIYGGALLALVLIAPWQASNASLTVYLLAASVATMLLLALAAWASIRVLGSLRRHVGVSWRYGLASVARRGRESSIQVVALGLGIMAMLLITLVHKDLIAGWQRSVPADAPNQFVINIPPDEVRPLQQFLADSNLRDGGVLPMVRGRLTHINDRPVNSTQFTDQRAQRLVDREFNLSWAASMQADNRIESGRWWSGQAKPVPQFSVETGIAETLALKLGDRLTYDIAGQRLTAPITSLRRVQWDSFNVNFFVIGPPGMLDAFPSTYITSFHLDSDARMRLSDLASRFPSVTIIDVAAVLEQVRMLIGRVNLAVGYVFLFTLAAGALVLIAALQATQDERTRESALLRSLGASRAMVRRGLLAEFMVIGIVAGVLACSIASVVAWVLARQVFNIDYRFNLLLWPAGLLTGVGCVVVFGIVGLRRALSESPVSVLRRT